MRIGIYDPYLDDIGGGERYMVTMASALSTDNDVSVYWDNVSDLKKVGKRFVINIENLKIEKNIFKNTSLLKKEIELRNKEAIVFLSDGSLPLVLSKKFYLHIQQPLSYRKKSMFEDYKISRITKIICNSEYTRSYVDKIFPKNKTVVIYPPVSLIGSNAKKENIIFHVGRLRFMHLKNNDYKKQGFMIKVFKSLIKEGLKDWKFVLAVSSNNLNDPKFAKIKKSAEGYPIEFLVNYNKDKLWREGSKAKIYWHATGYGENLEEHPEFAEHFGISTVEAMSAGAVPVVIDAGGQNEIITDGENGLLWKTENDFKEKTLKLVNDARLLEKLSHGAEKRANDFSEEKFKKEVRDLIL